MKRANRIEDKSFLSFQRSSNSIFAFGSEIEEDRLSIVRDSIRFQLFFELPLITMSEKETFLELPSTTIYSN